MWFPLIPQARIPLKSELTAKETTGTVVKKNKKRPSEREEEPNSGVFPPKVAFSWSSEKSNLFYTDI